MVTFRRQIESFFTLSVFKVSLFRFIEHGMPSLLEEPIPELVKYVENDPYENSENPSEDPDKIQGFCAMKVA